MRMTEKQIQAELFRRLRSSCELMVPNYAPRLWWPCDLFVVTKSRLAHEYEIKLTVHDFRRDCEKASLANGVKHERLAAKDVRGPARFWYILPSGLVAEADIPAWAGLQEVEQRGRWLGFKVTKPAPLLHDNRVDDDVVKHARSVFYWRFWHERQKFEAYKRKFS